MCAHELLTAVLFFEGAEPHKKLGELNDLGVVGKGDGSALETNSFSWNPSGNPERGFWKSHVSQPSGTHTH